MEEHTLFTKTIDSTQALPDLHADSNQDSDILLSSSAVVESSSLVPPLTPLSHEILDSDPLSRNHHAYVDNQDYDDPSGAGVGEISTIVPPIAPLSTETPDPLPSPLNHIADHNHDLDQSSPAAVESDSSPNASLLSRNTSFSSLNAQAPEFVPARTDLNLMQQSSLVSTMPVQHHQNQEHHNSQQAVSDSDQSSSSRKKILNQVEYYFSDLNLATTDHLMSFINKDPEGFVPMSVVSGFKKIKSVTSSHSQLAEVLRNSRKLVVSEDGKKVRRRQLLTESDMEELQSRIVVAENLPEDHCYQNLMKIFSTVGRVKTIRTCQHQNSNGGSSASRSTKSDSLFYSNKVHAFVEYESVESAEKAVAELNGEGRWRNSLKVWVLVKQHQRKSKSRMKKANDNDGEEITSEETQIQLQPQQSADDGQGQGPQGQQGEEEPVNNEILQRKGGGRTRGGRGSKGGGRGRCVGSPQSIEHASPGGGGVKQPPGPRMPDGTRGFSIGRGKPIAVNTTA